MTEFSSCISDYAAIYRWWSYSPERRVLKHLDFPIIFSIATLRSHNPGLPIYVIDFSDGEYDWEDFTSRFNFVLVPYKSVLETTTTKRDVWTLANDKCLGRGPLVSASEKVEHNLDALDLRSCSWPIDMSEICSLLPERVLLSIDSDIFWVKPLLPLEGDAEKFNCRPNNTGFFYFDKQCQSARRWLELWQAYVSLAVRDFNFRRTLVNLYAHPAVIKAAKPFLYAKDMLPESFDSMVFPMEPHTSLLPSDHQGYGFEQGFADQIKSVHVSGKTMGRWKGKFPLFFTEIFDRLRPMFSIQELIEVFQLDTFNNSIFSLENLSDPLHSPFYNQLASKMYAQIRPL